MQELLTLVVLLIILYDIYSRKKGSIEDKLQTPIRIELSLSKEAVQEEEGSQEPISREVLEYINQESDEWARGARKTMARKYYKQSTSWDEVLHQLQMEDKID